MPKPYYQSGGITLYCGDAREIVPQLTDRVDCVCTDPVWPNPIPELIGSENPFELFWDVARHFHKICDRAIVQIGCTSDPRFLMCVPGVMPFLRVVRLEWMPPRYVGRVLYDADYAYVFGRVPSTLTCSTLPGHVRKVSNGRSRADGGLDWHPCPRSLEHVDFLLKWFCEGTVLDPFAGAGTTLMAAKRKGVDAVGIEIHEPFCEGIARRLEGAGVDNDLQMLLHDVENGTRLPNPEIHRRLCKKAQAGLTACNLPQI